ncbi:MAG: DUF2231 domain-containing protein [Nocardioidaceae bacterium]
MFNEFNGLPLHALAIHASVVIVPLAALLALLFALPRTRAWSRLPLLVVSVGGLASVFVSVQSGKALDRALNLQGPVRELINTHRHRANQLLVLMVVFTVLVVVAYVVTRSAALDATVTHLLAALLVLSAIALSVQVYRVGDVGARAVWNPTGQIDYSGDGTGG